MRGAIGLTLLVFCGCGSSWNAPPVFPGAPGEAWKVPLHEPLTAHNPLVWVDMEGVPPAEGAPAPVVRRLMLVDSGAAVVGLDPETLGQLRVPIEVNRNVQMVDAQGERRPWRGGTVPAFRLGPLELRQVVSATSPGALLLGRNVLDERPWELDLDRGVLVVGAPEWSGPGIATLDMTRRDGEFYVEARLDHADLLLYFDTGASLTAVDADTARGEGFRRIALQHEATFTAVTGQFQVKEMYAADLSFAGLGGGVVPLTPLPEFHVGGALNQKVVGLLGYTAMARFRMRVEPGSAVQFRARGDVLATARERIERWPWVPSCAERPGCVEVDGHDQDGKLEISLRYEKAYDQPVTFLLACVGPDGHVDHAVDFVEVTRARVEAGHEDALHVGPGKRKDEFPAAGACPRMALLDVNPAPTLPSGPEGYAVTFARSVLAPPFKR
jgi:predicted aspartyl protease